MAQMSGENYCTGAVQHHELYGALYKWYKGERRLMHSRWNTNGVPGKTIYINVRYDCTSESVWRNWDAQADGYALMDGVWYGGTQTRSDAMYCG
jgi:hypothetical protein